MKKLNSLSDIAVHYYISIRISTDMDIMLEPLSHDGYIIVADEMPFPGYYKKTG